MEKQLTVKQLVALQTALAVLSETTTIKDLAETATEINEMVKNAESITIKEW